MTQDLPSEKNDGDPGLNWPRIAGLSFVIAIHAAALLLLLAPVAPPGEEKADEDVTRYSMPFFVHPFPECVLKPLASTETKENPAKYEAITADAFLKQRLREIGLIK